jgi:hypothetical protein
MMKNIAIAAGVALVLAATTQSVSAQKYGIEGDGWIDASPEITALIQRTYPHRIDDPDGDCRPLKMLPPEHRSRVRIVIPGVHCWGVHNAPIWAVAAGSKPRVLVATGGAGISLRPRASGFPDVTITDASAAYESVERWRFNGAKYVSVYQKTTDMTGH